MKPTINWSIRQVGGTMRVGISQRVVPGWRINELTVVGSTPELDTNSTTAGDEDTADDDERWEPATDEALSGGCEGIQRLEAEWLASQNCVATQPPDTVKTTYQSRHRHIHSSWPGCFGHPSSARERSWGCSLRRTRLCWRTMTGLKRSKERKRECPGPKTLTHPAWARRRDRVLASRCSHRLKEMARIEDWGLRR